MVPINTRFIADGLLRVDPRKRPIHDLYLLPPPVTSTTKPFFSLPWLPTAAAVEV
jgi:hypothetical protein